MKKTIYYVYAHVRKDNGKIFYIGIGRRSQKKQYDRANDLRANKRNFMWNNVFVHCGSNIKVIILAEYPTLIESQAKEIELISQYGRLIDKKGGILANISVGGEYGGRPPKKLIQYDLSGKPIKIWENMYVAADKYKVTFKSISASINRGNACKGYQWRWYDEESKNLGYIEKYVNKSIKAINQFDSNGNFMRKYKSVAEAALITNIDRSGINHCAIGSTPTSGGYIWSYNESVTVKKKRLIIQYNFKQDVIHIYYSLIEITRALDLPSTTAIRNCFCGKQKQAYGFLWEQIFPDDPDYHRFEKEKKLGLSTTRLDK